MMKHFTSLMGKKHMLLMLLCSMRGWPWPQPNYHY